MHADANRKKSRAPHKIDDCEGKQNLPRFGMSLGLYGGTPVCTLTSARHIDETSVLYLIHPKPETTDFFAVAKPCCNGRKTPIC